jgi:hypothetical protein
LGYIYFRFRAGGGAGGDGLISFVGVAQFLPALMGGLFWRGATRKGALTGLSLGFAVWLYCLFLPSFGPSGILPAHVFDRACSGCRGCAPRRAFRHEGMDPVIHATFWSLTLNCTGFVLVSLFTLPRPMERLQGAQFVNVFQHSGTPGGWSGGFAQSEDLFIMSQRIMGAGRRRRSLPGAARRRGLPAICPNPRPISCNGWSANCRDRWGPAAAHAMVSQIVGRATVSVDDLLAVADETAQIMEYSSQLRTRPANRPAPRASCARPMRNSRRSRCKRMRSSARSATSCARP